MKREVFSHPKTLDLATRLGIPTEYAAGILGKMWDWCADYAPQGNIGKWPNSVIASAVNWRSDADEFVEALLDSEWLDRDAEHRLLVHDVRDHAPNWWHAKLKKLHLEFLNPSQERSKEASEERSIEPSKEASQPKVSRGEEGAILPTSANPCSANPKEESPSTLSPSVNPPDSGGDEDSPKPKRTRSKQYDPSDVELPFPSLEFRIGWQSWVQHRSEIKKPLKATMVTEQLAMLAEMGEQRALAMIRHTIAMGWQGLREPEQARAGPAQKKFSRTSGAYGDSSDSDQTTGSF